MSTPQTPLENRKIFLICNAHLDPVWLWEWEEGAAAAISTFRTAADLCEQFPALVFNHNEAILYRWVEEFEPALFARIQRLVREGRWHIMGGWHLQPDCNMPSGESFVRQILLGRQYFSEKFGQAPTTAINFDPFGHTRGLVQILARSGFDSYIFCRPDQVDCPLPQGPFLWEGYDGSRVMAVRPWGHYLSHLGKARAKVEQYLRDQPQANPGILLWGVGDHGGGPSRQDVEDLSLLIAGSDAVDICHAAPEDYFAAIRAGAQDLPIHTKDLNPWAVGCYTSMAQAKYRHRLLENELYLTEKLASAAWINALLAYPQSEINEAMRDLATAEFHDILPGSSIQPVEEMALRLMNHGMEILSRVKARAFFALTQGQPPAHEGEIPVMVYNPHPYPVDAVIECEFQLADQNWGNDFTIATAFQAGQPLPTQIEQEMSSLNLDWRKRVIFRAALAPSQMNRFDCRLERVPARPRPPATGAEALHFQNDRLEVIINPNTGLIDRMNVDDVEYLQPGAGRLLVIADSPDPWGMTVRSFRKRLGAFRLLSPRRSAWLAAVSQPELSPIRIIEDGPVRMVVEALFGYRNSFAVLRYKLPRQGCEIEVELRVYWNEKDRMLKLSLPVSRQVSRRRPHFTGQVAFGVAGLPENGDEAVAHKWLALSGEEHALTVINDRTYGSDFADHELRLTLLRSPGYSAHPILDRPILPSDRFSPRIDQGERLFRFWLQGGPVSRRMEQVDREALAHNEQPVALSFFPNGEGRLPAVLARLSDPAVQITAIKKTEAGEYLLLRLYNPTARQRTTTLDLPVANLSIPVELAAYEIRTLRVDPQTGQWTPVNLVEEA